MGNGLEGATVTIDGQECEISSASTNTQLTFTYPPLPAGTYEVLISTPIGWTYPRIDSITELHFDEPITYSGS